MTSPKNAVEPTSRAPVAGEVPAPADPPPGSATLSLPSAPVGGRESNPNRIAKWWRWHE